MVDRLKKSLENLEPPDCPNCHVEMKWFESKLVRPEPALTIDHHFACDSCGRGSKRRETVEALEQTPPAKLAQPRHRLHRAA